MAEATFGAGCFWGVEEAFRKLPGVLLTQVGYAGGITHDPSYEQVCSHNSGHAEVVQVEFNPEIISYEQLLDVFWKLHDPTTLNRQGPDVGSQYRSIIFYHTEEQRLQAEEFKEQLEQSGIFPSKIVTEILPECPFYRAEEYHQQYLKKKRG
ncbi:MAG: peptide-methionine (S)-S-oxide reductase MsrA [Gammaproteobacteria bacterium]|nr:peptide-methionine (S)-S-oxide reductase MsrA [Gammaproteobacteria bacterium]